MNVYMLESFLRWCMTIAIISCVIAGVGLVCTLLGCVINLSVKIGKVLATIDMIGVEAEHNREKFQQLFDFKSTTETDLAYLRSEVSQISQDTKEIKSDIRSLMYDKTKRQES